jgi:hypothetical protein
MKMRFKGSSGITDFSYRLADVNPVVALLFARVGPNRFYGIRIAKAYESTEMWYKVNRIGAKIFLGYGAVMLAVEVVAAFISTNLRLTFAPLLIGNLLLTLASIVHVLIACNRIN